VPTEFGSAGTEPEQAAHAIGSLAAVHSHMGHFAMALPLREEALELRRRLLGEAHLDTLNSMHGLGRCLVGVGERVPRLEMLEAVVATARRVLGEAHPTTKHFAEGLAKVRGEVEVTSE